MDELAWLGGAASEAWAAEWANPLENKQPNARRKGRQRLGNLFLKVSMAEDLAVIEGQARAGRNRTDRLHAG